MFEKDVRNGMFKKKMFIKKVFKKEMFEKKKFEQIYWIKSDMRLAISTTFFIVIRIR